MSKTNFVEAELTRDGITANANQLIVDTGQVIANEGKTGVTELNDPNLMSVIEKQTQVAQYSGLTSQYNVLLERAKNDGIDTTALTKAYNALNAFMGAILGDPTKASDVDRDNYKTLQDDYNAQLSLVQTALANNTRKKFSDAESQTAVAQKNATDAKTAASAAVSYADYELSKTASATSQAQSQASEALDQADNAFAKAQTAIDSGNVTSQAVTDLKDGSKMTIANLENGLASKVATSEFASYQVQTASQIASKVANDSFNTYKTQTADLINSKVASSQYSSDKQQTANLIESKVEATDFNTYKTQTATALASKVSSDAYSSKMTQIDSAIQTKVSQGDFDNLTISNRNLALGTATPVTATGTNTNNQVIPGYKFSSVIPRGTLVTVTFDITSSTGVGTYTMQFNGNDSESSWQTISTGNLVSGTKHISVILTTDGNHLHFYPRLDSATGTITISNFIISESSKEVNWTPAPEDKVDLNNVINPNLIPYSGYWKDLTGWTKMSWGATDKTLSLIKHNFYHNAADNTLVVGTAQKDTASAGSVRFQVTPNTTYTFSFSGFASSNVVGTNVYFLCRKYGSTSDYETVHSLFSNLIMSPSGINRYTVTFTTGASDNEGYIRLDNLGSNNGASSGSYFAELKMEKGSVDTPYIQTYTSAEQTITADNINLKVSTNNLIDQINIRAGSTLISSSGQLTLSADTVYFDTKKPVIIPSANIANLLVNKQLTAANISANTFSSNNGTFTVDANGLVTASSLIIRGSTNLVYNAGLLGGNGSNIPGWNMNGEGYYSNATLFDGVPGLAWAGTAASGVWDNYATTYYQPISQTGIPYSASGIFRDYGSANGMMFQCTLAFFTTKSTASRIAGYKSFNYTANGGDSGQKYFTIDNCVAPSNAKYVALQFWAYNGKGHAVWSQPMLTQTAKATGYQPDTGNVVSAGEIDGTVINGSTINGTTINTGSQMNSYGNTSYPLTVRPDGSVISTIFKSVDSTTAALRTVLKDGIVETNLRGMTPFATGKYSAADVSLGAGQLALYEGYSTTIDPNFTQTGLAPTGYVLLDAGTGVTLHGDNQWVRFNGQSTDKTPRGVVMTPYGNINPQGDQVDWYVGWNNKDKSANFGIDSAHKVNINLYRPTYVDEIGALGQLENGRIKIHAVDGNAQMYLLNDGSPAFVSPTIYNRTYSNGANVFVTSAGRVGRSTSASKYKLAIQRTDDTTQADRLLTIRNANWNDKVSTEKIADAITTGEDIAEAEINLKRHYGLIAEDIRDAGLDEFLISGVEGQIEGIEYDRLWTVLIPKIRQLNNRINELERRVL